MKPAEHATPILATTGGAARGAELLDLPRDVLASIFTEHGLEQSDLHSLDRVCTATRAALRAPGIAPFVVDTAVVEATEYGNLAAWLRKNAAYVSSVEVLLGDYTTDHWGLFTGLLDVYWETGAFPGECHLVIEDEWHLKDLRVLSFASNLPPIQFIDVCIADDDAETAAACRDLLKECHRFRHLTYLSFAIDLAEGLGDEEDIGPIRLPDSLERLILPDSTGRLSEAVVLSPSLLELSVYATPQLVRAMPTLPSLVHLSTSGDLEAEDAALLFSKTPSLQVIDFSYMGKPLLLRDLPLVPLPPQLTCLEIRVESADALRSASSPVFQLQRLKTCNVAFDIPNFEESVIINAAVSDTAIRKLVLHSRVPVQLPDLRPSRLETLEVHAPKMSIRKAGAHSISVRRLNFGDRLFYEDDDTFYDSDNDTEEPDFTSDEENM